MLSAFLVLNPRGKVLISRTFRPDIDPRNVASAFRTQVINSKHGGSRNPIKQIGSSSFFHIREGALYVVAVTKLNANAALIFELLHKIVNLFKAYFSNKFNEESLRDNYAVIYELIDETIDFGYPQITEPDLLKTFITTKGFKPLPVREMSEITKQVTGVVSWRPPNVKYKRNEVFLDVIENVNMLLGKKGNVLNADVTGKIIMKAYLSGQPECKFGINDKLLQASQGIVRGRSTRKVELDDITFHQCVKLQKFDSDRTISFIPADGEFELMKYRITNGIVPPFRLVSPIVKELGKTRWEIRITVKSIFNSRLFGKNVIVTIPCPPNTAKCNIRCGAGKAKYRSQKSAIEWKIKRFPGSTEYSLAAEVNLIATTVEGKAWSKPPITLNFQVPMFTASGVHVRFLKVYEPKLQYQTIKWVRYITQAGTYEQRA